MIAEALADYALATRRTWTTDRSNTVGASEIGQCARRTAFAKGEDDASVGVERDDDYEDGWGAMTRGSVIEDHFWVPAMRRTYGDRLLYAGREQRTFVSGYLSATPDGLLVESDGTCTVLDCKTVDPRTNLVEPKLDHVFQVQVQIGLVRETTNHRPERGILSYIDASLWDKVTEFPVTFARDIYATAKSRAHAIMSARSPLDLSPEGIVAGRKECERCPFTRACGQARADRVPFSDKGALTPEALAEATSLARLARHSEAVAEKAEIEARQYKQQIRDIMAGAGTRRVPGVATWSAVKGRSSWDNEGVRKAAEAAGVDLSPYRRVGDPSDMLTINLKV